jgi:hypothetical protein
MCRRLWIFNYLSNVIHTMFNTSTTDLKTASETLFLPLSETSLKLVQTVGDRIDQKQKKIIIWGIFQFLCS